MKITAEVTDEILVAQSVEGDRDAFQEIVRRYQVLLCSVAYSASGNVSQSEDVAQETLVAAWTQLSSLREPAKLKSWLCGIARNLAHNSHRRDARRGTQSFETLDPALMPASDDPRPDEIAARADDESLTWRALELVPETYRETLVLYYRQHQSIEHVAVLLDVTEETVRQRLSRGRKALQDQVLSLLGTTLTRTVPAVAFTTSVMSALPIASAPAFAASAGSGGALMKGGAVKTVFGTLLGFSGLAALLGAMGLVLGNRVAVELTDSQRERAYIASRGRGLQILVGVLVLGLPTLFWGLPAVANVSIPSLAVTGMVFVAIWTLAIFLYSLSTMHRQMEIRREDAQSFPPTGSKAWLRYCSPSKFLGLPLLAINMNDGTPVRAWIAIGQIAQGGLLAVGNLAIAPIAFGGCGIGLLSFAAIGMGLFSFSGLAVGWYAAGAFAFGFDAIGGIAIASHFAAGGIAWAAEFAQGARALAPHANDAEAFHALQTHPFFRFYYLMPIAGAVQGAVALIPSILLLKRLKTRKASKG